ncbi:MAG TPA: hypothetical protein PLH29_00030 [bacterium]|nr:hypothetical protein [bacterium]
MKMESNINQIKRPEQPVEFIYGKYSIDDEFESLREVYEEMDWYKKHNYEPHLPEHSKFKEIEKISDKEDIDWEKLKEIFANEIYNDNYTHELEGIKQQESFLMEAVARLRSLKEKYNLEIFSTYEIIFKTYGMGGTYGVGADRGKVILRKNDNPDFNYGITCIHEMIHIGIEKSIVQEHDLSQSAKERLVDLIIREDFGDMAPTYVMQDETADRKIDEFVLDRKTGKFVDDIEASVAEFAKKFPEDEDKED